MVKSKVIKKRKTVEVKKFHNFKNRLRFFLNNTTIHGMKYLLRKPYFMEFIWMISLAFLLSVMGFSLYLCNFKYENTKIGLSIKTDHLDWTHRFPAFTLCHREYVKWASLLNFIRNYWKANNIMYTHDRIAYYEMAMDYLFISPYRFPSFNDTLCAGLNDTCGLDFESMRKALLPTNCHQFVSNVKYLNKTYDCSKLFVKTNHHGSCFVVNGDYERYGFKRSGPQLMFDRQDFQNNKRVALQMDLRSFNGAQLQLYIHSPEEESAFYESYYVVKPEYTRTHVMLNTVEFENDPKLANIDLSLRNCRFPNEPLAKYHLYYGYTRCIMLMRIEQELKACHCVLPTAQYIFHKKMHCNVTGIKCLKAARSTHLVLKSKDIRQKCAQTCTEMIVNIVGFNEKTYANGRKDKDKELGKLVVEVVNLPTERYHRSITHDNLYYFVAVGTIVGLYTGASLMTLCEIIYLFFVRK